jgi:peroxiredoxin
MLQFTASWCGVCRKEMPHIEDKIWKVYKDKGLKLFGIDRGEPRETVVAFAGKMNITYPLAMDEEEAIFQKFAHKNAGVTRNVLIDRDGNIVYLTRLFNMEEFNGLVDKIDELLL